MRKTIMRSSNILIRKDPIYQKCPDCKTVGSLRNSRSRSIIESLIKKVTFIKIYRCRECGWRGYRSTIGFTFESFKTLFFYVAIALVCGFVVKMIIKRFL